MRPDDDNAWEAQTPLDRLIAMGCEALNAHDYPRAVELLREAVRRSPFRQDLRDWLAMALEGAIEIQRAQGRGAPGSRHVWRTAAPGSRAMPDAPPTDTLPDRAQAAAPASSEFEWTPPRTLPGQGRHVPSAPVAPPTVAPIAPRRPVPSQFERRHRRGPLSAIVMGAVFGVVMIGGVGAGLWWYGQRQAGGGIGNVLPSLGLARQTAIFDQANEYLARGETALAIDTLMQLPPGPARDRQLALIYMTRGDQHFRRQPPNFEAAIEAYTKALEYEPDNPRYGNALGLAYYTMGRSSPDAATRERCMARALDVYRSVVQLSPRNTQDLMTALKGMADAAVALRDDVTAAEAWRRMIAVDPDSPDAAQARNHLITRGLRVD